jgi:hypothetical protein
MGFFGLNQVVGISIAPLFGGILLDMFPQSSLAIWGIIAGMGLVGLAPLRAGRENIRPLNTGGAEFPANKGFYGLAGTLVNRQVDTGGRQYLAYLLG